jgi:hypothetical protein
VGPLHLFGHARISVSGPNRTASGGKPAQTTVGWLVPFGVGVALRFQAGPVRPLGFAAAQLALSSSPVAGVTVLPGFLVGGGVELPLGNSPLAVRPLVELGLLAPSFTLRAGLQLVVGLGRAGG